MPRTAVSRVAAPFVCAVLACGAGVSSAAGPFRVVVTGDKRPARWIRQVQSVEIFKASAAP